MTCEAPLTPTQQGRQTPGQRVEPDQQDHHHGAPARDPADGLQGLGDDDVAVQGDGQQVDHGGDAEQRPAECVHLTAWGVKCVSV